MTLQALLHCYSSYRGYHQVWMITKRYFDLFYCKIQKSYSRLKPDLCYMSYNDQPQQRLYSNIFLCMGFYNQATIIYRHLQASFFVYYVVRSNLVIADKPKSAWSACFHQEFTILLLWFFNVLFSHIKKLSLLSLNNTKTDFELIILWIH